MSQRVLQRSVRTSVGTGRGTMLMSLKYNATSQKLYLPFIEFIYDVIGTGLVDYSAACRQSRST